MSSNHILVAVGDPVLHPEAMHVAAATGHGVVDTLDPREITRLAPRARALLVDSATAAHVATLDRRSGIHFLVSDPGPVDWRAAMKCHADDAWVLPAQATDLLAALGHVVLRGASTPERRPGPGTEPGDSHIIAVCGAAGGAGTSTLAAAVARTAARRHPVTLIDADDRSGGLDLLLGLEDQPGARWPDLRLGEGTVAVEDLRAALPATPDGRIAVLSAARSALDDPFRLQAEHVAPVLEALRGGPGVTVVDLAGHGGLLDAVTGHCDSVALLIPAEVRPAAAAARLTAHLTRCRIVVSPVARNRNWSGLTSADLETLIGKPVIADLGNLTRLTRAGELGGLPERLPGQLSAAARLVLEDAGVPL